MTNDLSGPVVPELLPCPFCGSDGDILRLCDTRPAGSVWVSCDICEMEGPASQVGRDPAGAAEAWNTRAAPRPEGVSSASVEVLREALEQWTCGSCGGSGVYRNKFYSEATDDIHEQDVECKVCCGSGQNPIARAALTSPTSDSVGEAK